MPTVDPALLRRLFVIVGGADRAGLTANLLQPIQVWDLHRLPIFVTATAVLSNVVSNVCRRVT